MSKYSDSFKRAAASLAAVCTLGTCCIAGSVAWAADGETKPTAPSTADIINNDENNKTSITIHKFEGPELKNVAHDGRELVTSGANSVLKNADGTDKKPVKNVEFTIWRLKSYQTGPEVSGTKSDEDIDLSKAEGWKKIDKIQYLKLPDASNNGTTVYTVDQLMKGDANLSPALTQQFNKYTNPETDPSPLPAAACTATAAQTKYGAKCVTGKDGSVKLDKLPMGLYYIEETNISKAEIDGKKVSITKTVAPFFITTPLPNSDPDSQKTTPWLYNVHVYPKNDTNPVLPTKTGDVNRNDLVGDTKVNKKNSTEQKTVEGTHITWTIAIPLTAPNGKDEKNNVVYKKIGFVDRLDDKLTFVNDDAHKLKAKIVVYKEQTKKDSTEKEWVPDSGTDAIAEATLTADDYTLTEPKKGAPTTGNNNTLTFKLKENSANHGLDIAKEKYEKASASKDVKKLAKLVVEIVTKVDNTSLNEIANVANTFVDDNKTGDGDGTDPCVPGDETNPNKPQCHDKDIPNTVMHYGTLTVSKFFNAGAKKDTTGTKMPLNGAKFDIYEVTGKAAAEAGKPATKVEANDIKKTTTFDAVDLTQPVKTIARTAKDNVTAATFNVKKITHKEPADEATNPATDEATTLETHHNDTAKTDGKDSVKLLVYSAPKGNPNSVGTDKLYCLVETKAPAGYRLDSAPHCVWLQEDLTAGGTVTEQNVAARVLANTVEVENSRATELDKIIGALPMTGARGLVILTICGILGVAGTFFYIVLKRRKEQEQE